MRRLRWLVILPALLHCACRGILGLTEGQPASTDGGLSPATETEGGAGPIETGRPTCTADLSRDGNNCGRCEHSCGRGICSEGTCRPFVLTTLPNGAHRLVGDENYLYVAPWSAPAAIVRITKADGTAKTLSHTTGAHGIAQHGPELYWSTVKSEDSPGHVYKCDLPLCDPRRDLALVGSDFGNVRSLAPANGFGGASAVAWLDLGRGEVATPGSTPSSSQRLAMAATGERGFIHLVGDTLYWSESAGQKLGRLKRGTTSPEWLDVAPYDIGDFAVVGETLLVLTGGGSAPAALMRGRLGTTSIENFEVVGSIEDPEQVLLSGALLLVLSSDGLRSCESTDCDSLTVLAQPPNPSSMSRFIAVDADDTTIWFTSPDGVVYGLAK